MDGNFDAISVTAYAGLRQDQLATFDEFTTADEIIDSLLEVSVPWSLEHITEHQVLADQYSQILGREIDLLTYEGGSHPSAYGSPAQDAAHEASLSPRMYDVYQTLLNGAEQIGVDQYNQYVFTGGGAPARWGDWGLLHTMDQALEESYEYQSILDFINSQTPEVLPVVNIESTVSSVEESGSEQLEFILTRSADQLDTPLTVNYQISGTATSSADFTSLTGEVTFAANEASVTILVNILENLLDENDETLELQLLDQETYDLGAFTQASGSIIDNDFTNIAPDAAPISNQSIVEGELFSLNASSYFSDANTVDGDQFTLSAMLTGGAALPDWLVFTPETGELSGTPSSINTGTLEIVITATDLAGLETNAAFQLTVTPILTTQWNIIIVETPTITSVNGEIVNLPASVNSLTEWQTFWVEVWVSIPDSSSTGIETFSFHLNYNTEYTTATSIEYGSAFSENQTGVIDDATGIVQNISAHTNLIDAGDDQTVLLARIQFTPTANDQVSLDLASQSIGPYQTGISIDQPALQLSDQAENQLGTVNLPEAGFWAIPYDFNDDDAITYKDLMKLASVYGTNVAESNSPIAWFMDFNQSGTVSFRDLFLLAVNYGKSKLNNPSVILPTNYPEAWAPQNLLAESVPQPQQDVTLLTTTQAETTTQAAIEIYSESVSLEEHQILQDTKVKVVDLPENTLAKATPGTILIDVSAAGYGWHVDSSPWDHSEFQSLSSLEMQAIGNSEASLHIDLLTVILHEMKHLLGHDHEASGLMKATLAPGIRRLPDGNPLAAHLYDEDDLQESDQFFSSLNDNDLLAFG